jgi:hypothetical protein
MPFTPDPPIEKTSGHVIRSKDWNDMVKEIQRLDTAKLDKTGGPITGPLSVSGALTVGTQTPEANRSLTIQRNTGAYLNLRSTLTGGPFEVLLGADSSGGIVSTLTNHDLQLRAGGDVTKMVIKAGGNVGIGTTTPQQKFHVDGNEILSTGGSAGFKFRDRGSVSNTDDWVWYSNGNLARFWRAGVGDLLNVTTSGFLGIGTTPTQKLQVAGNAIVNNVFLGDVGHSSAWAGFSHKDQVGQLSYGLLQRQDGVFTFINKKSGGGYIGFRVDNFDKMVINDNGDVGIGTTAPGAKLEINGGELWFKAATATPEDPGDIVFRSAGGGQKGRIWSNPTAGSGLFLSSGDDDPDITIDSNGNVVVTGNLNVGVTQGDRIKIGVPSPRGRYTHNGIRGEIDLWLDAQNTVYIKPGFQTPTGFDIAERFKSAGRVEPGDVVVFDEENGAVTLCAKKCDKRVIGIASTEPAFILGGDSEHVPIALCGRVECKVDADVAPIEVGDLLTTSPTKGHAQKALDPGKAVGAIIGKALASFSRGKGKILVLVLLQ